MTNDTIILNGTAYSFDIILMNGEKSTILPKMLFNELVIDESFIRWEFRGYLIYDNSFEQLERYKENGKTKNSEFFYFRMDGTDEIIIELTPLLDAETSRAKKTKKDFPVDIMSLKLRGSIYDSEDLSKDTIENKQKKIYFWDKNYNNAISINTRVSCGEYIAKNDTKTSTDVTNLNNLDRRVFISDLVKYICEDKLEAKVSDDWETCANTSFYVSPPTSTLSDDLNYLISGCYDDIGYPPYFRFDRFNNEFHLISYETIFKNYDKMLKEQMHFIDPYKPNKGIVPIRGDTENIFSIPTFSNILSYKYTKMSGSDSIREINSRMLSGYDSANKTFKTNVKWGHILNVKKLYKRMLSKFPNGNKKPLLILNNDKMTNKNVTEDYALEPRAVVQKTIESALMLNDMIHFECLGLPNRTPGTFIEIVSDTDTQGIWEDRFLGTWFIVNVEHKITNDGYTNKILAVKPNMSDASEYPDGTELPEQELEIKDTNK